MLPSDIQGILIRWCSIPFGYSHKLFKETGDQHGKNFQQVAREGEDDVIEQNFFSCLGNINIQFRKLLSIILIIVWMDG